MGVWIVVNPLLPQHNYARKTYHALQGLEKDCTRKRLGGLEPEPKSIHPALFFLTRSTPRPSSEDRHGKSINVYFKECCSGLFFCIVGRGRYSALFLSMLMLYEWHG